jgi:hypothetical protein
MRPAFALLTGIAVITSAACRPPSTDLYISGVKAELSADGKPSLAVHLDCLSLVGEDCSKAGEHCVTAVWAPDFEPDTLTPIPSGSAVPLGDACSTEKVNPKTPQILSITSSKAIPTGPGKVGVKISKAKDLDNYTEVPHVQPLSRP